MFSTSDDTPDPRVRKIESIWSKNTMTGTLVHAALERFRRVLSR